MYLSTVWSRMFSAEEMRILMVGLDAAGKTTILCACRTRTDRLTGMIHPVLAGFLAVQTSSSSAML